MYSNLKVNNVIMQTKSFEDCYLVVEAYPEHMPFKFTPEDQRLLQECNKEAFYQRCLPCATGFAGLTFMAVKAGYLKPHLTWGPSPKVVAAAFLGYFVGKISYQAICAEKLMANPNSELGAALRARRRQGGGGFQDTLTLDMPGLSLPKEGSSNVYSENIAPNTFTDLNTDRPYQDLDDHQPGFDSPQRQDDFILPPQAQNPNSYEELRRKNREDFEIKSRNYRAPAEPQRQYPPPRSPSDDTLEPIDRYRPTNAYGDIFDK